MLYMFQVLATGNCLKSSGLRVKTFAHVSLVAAGTLKAVEPKKGNKMENIHPVFAKALAPFTSGLTRKPHAGDMVEQCTYDGVVASSGVVIRCEEDICYYLPDGKEKPDSFIWRFKEPNGAIWLNSLFTIIQKSP